MRRENGGERVAQQADALVVAKKNVAEGADVGAHEDVKRDQHGEGADRDIARARGVKSMPGQPAKERKAGAVQDQPHADRREAQLGDGFGLAVVVGADRHPFMFRGAETAHQFPVERAIAHASGLFRRRMRACLGQRAQRPRERRQDEQQHDEEQRGGQQHLRCRTGKHQAGNAEQDDESHGMGGKKVEEGCRRRGRHPDLVRQRAADVIEKEAR